MALVILDGAGDRALCAGGDVLSLYNSRADGSGLARTFWREEYQLNYLIKCISTPHIAVLDGVDEIVGVGHARLVEAADPLHGALHLLAAVGNHHHAVQAFESDDLDAIDAR